MKSGPDFWLSECDTWWHDLSVDQVACHILDGPRPMIEGYHVHQWLVRVDPPVRDRGVETTFVLVDRHPPDRVEGEDWILHCTDVYSLDPDDPSKHIGGHKMTACTDPSRFLT